MRLIKVRIDAWKSYTTRTKHYGFLEGLQEGSLSEACFCRDNNINKQYKTIKKENSSQLMSNYKIKHFALKSFQALLVVAANDYELYCHQQKYVLKLKLLN